MLRRLGIAGAAAGLVAAAPAQAPEFAALARIERGLWQLRDAGGATRPMCIADPTALFHLRGAAAKCSRFVVENTPANATVSYTCPGGGQGRTAISVETPRLMRIQTQGIDGGMPFELEVEARRTGACG